MDIRKRLQEFLKFLKEDSWKSWLALFLLIIVVIKLAVFPLLSLLTGTPLPIVIIESCSMYHAQEFDDWWTTNQDVYALYNITQEEFESFRFANGLNKGDIIFLWGKSSYALGDTIVFDAGTQPQQYPIIHRIVREQPLGTKGDNNNLQLAANAESSNNKAGIDESNISLERVQGKAVARVPFLGWVKLIFFDWRNPSEKRGFCSQSTQPKL